MAWKSHINLYVLKANLRVITTRIIDSNVNQTWLYHIVYGDPSTTHKRVEWDPWIRSSGRYQGPMICMGDWNCFTEATNKLGGTPLLCHYI